MTVPVALQNFVNGQQPTIGADWLNAIDVFWFTVFNKAQTVAAARTALGLGSMALQNAAAVAITGGTIAGVTISGLTAALAIADGGTGQTTAAGAFNALKQAATTAATGVVQLATQAQMDAGTVSVVPTTDLNKISQAATVPTTSGTSVTFTGLPAGVREVSVMVTGLSTNGTAGLRFRLGPVAGVETSGYNADAWFVGNSTASGAAATAGFDLNAFAANTDTLYGHVTFRLLDAATNTWSAVGNFFMNGSNKWVFGCVGTKALAGALSVVSITTTNGTDTLDAGSASLQYVR